MLWINFLHLYQPANTDAHIIKEATEKSYRRTVRALEEHPEIKFTLNIQGCLFLRWEELGYVSLVKRIKKLVQKGQIEITGTCAYHPLAPLAPIDEIEKQIRANEKILKKHFGDNFMPQGFFLPEMAYGVEVARLIKKCGYEWIILDEISSGKNIGDIDLNKVYLDNDSGLKVVFRDRKLSQNFVPDILGNDARLKEYENEKNTYVTATDAEIYGLRHIDHTAEFEKLLKNKDLKTATISSFIEDGRKLLEIDLVSSNWESTRKELENDLPYALWNNPKNKVQKKLWKLAYLAYNVIEGNKTDENYDWARWHLVRGFASCAFWWASARDFKLFGAISWSPDEIERGVNELIRSVRALQNEETRDDKIYAEKLYIEIKQMIWEKHWKYYWKK